MLGTAQTTDMYLGILDSALIFSDLYKILVFVNSIYSLIMYLFHAGVGRDEEPHNTASSLILSF